MGDALLGDAYQLIQVSTEITNPKTLQREVSALTAAMSKYGIDESAIVTMDTEDAIEAQSGIIRVVPAWKWLID